MILSLNKEILTNLTYYKMFTAGKFITTNKLNCFEIIAVNETSVVCQDVITKDFCIFEKTEHKFEVADVRVLLSHSLLEILSEVDISPKTRNHIFDAMHVRIHAWVK